MAQEQALRAQEQGYEAIIFIGSFDLGEMVIKIIQVLHINYLVFNH